MEYYLRRAIEQDVDLLFQWANDPIVRKNSFTTEKILYRKHCQWYKNLLERTDCRQYIYMYNEENIGQARIIINEDEAEISYSICREKRGLGHGKRLLRLLGRQVKTEFPDIKKLTAYVKPDNTASRKAFIDIGYTEKFSCYELKIDESELPEVQNDDQEVN